MKYLLLLFILLSGCEDPLDQCIKACNYNNRYVESYKLVENVGKCVCGELKECNKK